MLRPYRLLLAAGLVALAVPAFAGPGYHHLSDACQADLARLCPDAGPGCEAKACLKGHAANLSSACTADLAAAKQQRTAVRAACSADIGRLCSDADSRDERRHCLHHHADQLSPACLEALQSLRKAAASDGARG